MSEQDLIQIFGAVDLLDLPEKMLPIVLSNSEQRNDIYRKLLYINNYDVSKDWFQEIFEQRMSERKDKKTGLHPRYGLHPRFQHHRHQRRQLP